MPRNFWRLEDLKKKGNSDASPIRSPKAQAAGERSDKTATAGTDSERLARALADLQEQVDRVQKDAEGAAARADETCERLSRRLDEDVLPAMDAVRGGTKHLEERIHHLASEVLSVTVRLGHESNGDAVADALTGWCGDGRGQDCGAQMIAELAAERSERLADELEQVSSSLQKKIAADSTSVRYDLNRASKKWTTSTQELEGQILELSESINADSQATSAGVSDVYSLAAALDELREQITVELKLHKEALVEQLDVRRISDALDELRERVDEALAAGRIGASATCATHVNTESPPGVLKEVREHVAGEVATALAEIREQAAAESAAHTEKFAPLKQVQGLSIALNELRGQVVDEAVAQSRSLAGGLEEVSAALHGRVNGEVLPLVGSVQSDLGSATQEWVTIAKDLQARLQEFGRRLAAETRSAPTGPPAFPPDVAAALSELRESVRTDTAALGELRDMVKTERVERCDGVSSAIMVAEEAAARAERLAVVIQEVATALHKRMDDEVLSVVEAVRQELREAARDWEGQLRELSTGLATKTWAAAREFESARNGQAGSPGEAGGFSTVLDQLWDAEWEAGLLQLKRYKAERGDCLVPKEYIAPGGFELGRWVESQRAVRRDKGGSVFSSNRARQLDEMGFVWTRKARPWHSSGWPTPRSQLSSGTEPRSPTMDERISPLSSSRISPLTSSRLPGPPNVGDGVQLPH